MLLKSGNPLIAIWVEELNPAVAVKDDFAFRDISKVIAYSGIFGLSRFWCEQSINGLIYQ